MKKLESGRRQACVRRSLATVLAKRQSLCPALCLQCFGCHGITLAQEGIAVGDPIAIVKPSDDSTNNSGAADMEADTIQVHQHADKAKRQHDASKLTWDSCLEAEDDSCFASCRCCFRVSCLGVLLFYVTISVLGSLAYVIFMAITDIPCGIGSYDASLILPAKALKAGINIPIEIGTGLNFETELPFDFGGIWWIRWTGYDGPQITRTSLTAVGYDYYDALHLEELVSFKGARVNTTNSSWFPLTFSAPTGRQHQWGFSSTIVGRVAMKFAAEKDPLGPLNINFINATFGALDGFGGAFISKIDNDQWLRSSGTVDDPYQAPAYRLTRIIYEDGSAHPRYWQAFLSHMGSVQIRTFLHNNRCARLRGTIPTSTCTEIKSECKA